MGARIFAVVGCIFFLGCSTDGDPLVSGAGGGGGSAGSTSGAPFSWSNSSGGSAILGSSNVSFDGAKFRVGMEVHDVAPGAEEHVCVVVELPNSDAVWVNDLHASLTSGTHHLIVDRETVGTPPQLTPQQCAPTMGGDVTRLMIAQQPETRVTLPPGTAFPLEPAQPIFLQLHYFNTTDGLQNVSGTAEFVVASDANPIEAKSTFTGTYSITIPPMSPATAQSFFVPAPETGSARHVFALTSHTHHLGVLATIERVASADAPATDPIHTSLDWAEPPLTTFDPPLLFDGSDGLRLICNYQNDTNATVTFGTAIDNEMCFMWVYYFDQ